MLKQLLGLITVASIKNYGSGFDPILTDVPGCNCILHYINCQTIHDIVIFILISSIKIKLATADWHASISLPPTTHRISAQQHGTGRRQPVETQNSTMV